MRREVVVALLVLVPFAALVALGFWFTPREAPAPGPGAWAVQPDAAVAPTVVRDTARGGHASGRQDDTLRAHLADSGVVELTQAFPPELAAPLAAVAGPVRQCLDDERGHLAGATQVRVRFTPTRDGGFTGVRVNSAAQNPWLLACVEDVFDEVRFTPTGAETFQPAEHAFGVTGP